jgi:hypothetical protein
LAFLIRPSTDKPIPATAVRCRINGIECVRWSKRGGGTVTGLVLPNGKCRVTSPTWWVEYRDAHGVRRRERVSRDRVAAEHRKAQIVVDVERQKGGLLPKAALPTGETLTALADEYRRHLEDMGRTDKHASETHQRIVVVLAECRWTTVADVTVGRWVRWVGESRRDGGFAADTVNHYLRSLRAFFRWMIDHRGLAADPLAAAEAAQRRRRPADTAAGAVGRGVPAADRLDPRIGQGPARAGRAGAGGAVPHRRADGAAGRGAGEAHARRPAPVRPDPARPGSRPAGRRRGRKCASRFPAPCWRSYNRGSTRGRRARSGRATGTPTTGGRRSSGSTWRPRASRSRRPTAGTTSTRCGSSAGRTSPGPGCR